MKKILICLLTVSMLLSVSVSCLKETRKAVSVAKDSYAKPVKLELSDEDMKLADKYYEEMISLYPQFGKIPREMLAESISRYGDNGYLNVSFVFCFGGIRTGCACIFTQSPKYPEGIWDVRENEFSQFYQQGLDENAMSEIRSSLEKGVSDYIDSHHLEKTEFSEENFPINWKFIDGKLYACCECIANTTALTTQKYGCGDHAHIFGRILVEINGDTVNLTAEPVTGD